MKHANVTPVPKSGDRHKVNNYRPVSVIPVLAKVLESLVHQQLYRYPESNCLLNSAQPGFRPHHCTQDVLLKTVDDWKIALDKGIYDSWCCANRPKQSIHACAFTIG